MKFKNLLSWIHQQPPVNANTVDGGNVNKSFSINCEYSFNGVEWNEREFIHDTGCAYVAAPLEVLSYPSVTKESVGKDILSL